MPPPPLIWQKEGLMKILSTTYLNLDKNTNLYIVVYYLDSKGKQRTIILNHYDLEYAVKGKIKYEINKQNKK